MSDLETKITEYIKAKYKPTAIILFGSRTLGMKNPQSDWDLFVFVEEKVNESYSVVDGEYLDLSFIVLQPFNEEFMVKTFGNVIGTFGLPNGAKLLFDSNNVGKNCLDKIAEMYARGRNLNERQISDRINFLSRRVSKIEYNLDDKNIFFYHLGFIFEKAIQYWFEVKHNKWTPAPKIALKEIKNTDPGYYEWLDKLSSEESREVKLKAAKSIVSTFKKIK